MINKVIPLFLVVGVLSGCDGGAQPKLGSVISNATNISSDFPAAYASLSKKAGEVLMVLFNPRMMVASSAIDCALVEAMVVGVSTNGSEKTR